MLLRDKTAEGFANAMDYKSAAVRAYAVNFARKAKGTYNLAQILWVWELTREDFAYISDPSAIGQIIEPASQLVTQRGGDCDKYTVMLASLIMAIGGFARFVVANGLAWHAYPEVYIGNLPHVRDTIIPILKTYYPDKTHYPFLDRFSCHVSLQGGVWLNLDRREHVGGELYDADTTREEAIYPDGAYRVLWHNSAGVKFVEDTYLPGLIARVSGRRNIATLLSADLGPMVQAIPLPRPPSSEWRQRYPLPAPAIEPVPAPPIVPDERARPEGPAVIPRPVIVRPDVPVVVTPAERPAEREEPVGREVIPARRFPVAAVAAGIAGLLLLLGRRK